MVKNRSLKNLFFIFLFFSIVLIPKNTFAETFTGQAVFFSQYGNIPNGIPTGYDSGLRDTIQFPSTSSTYLLPGAYPLQYTFYGVKQIGVVNSNYNYKSNTDYIVRLDFHSYGGSLVRSYSNWNISFDDTIVCDNNSVCGVNWVVGNGYTTAVINYHSNTLHTGSLFDLGSVNNVNKVVFANTSTDNTYIFIRDATIIEVNPANEGITDAINNQTTQIINNNNQNTQNIINNQNNNSQNIINNQNSNTNKILDDSLPTDTDDKLEDLIENDNLPSNVGIQDLITLPIRLYTSIISSANICEPVCFELLDTSFCFPCFDISSFFGVYWNMFDMLLCFVLLFKFATKLKEIFLNITQLDENKGDLIE